MLSDLEIRGGCGILLFFVYYLYRLLFVLLFVVLFNIGGRCSFVCLFVGVMVVLVSIDGSEVIYRGQLSEGGLTLIRSIVCGVGNSLLREDLLVTSFSCCRCDFGFRCRLVCIWVFLRLLSSLFSSV